MRTEHPCIPSRYGQQLQPPCLGSAPFPENLILQQGVPCKHKRLLNLITALHGIRCHALSLDNVCISTKKRPITCGHPPSQANADMACTLILCLFPSSP